MIGWTCKVTPDVGSRDHSTGSPQRLNPSYSDALCLIKSSGGIGVEDAFDLVPDAAKNGHLLFLRAGGVGGVVEAPVVTIDLTGE